MTRKIRKNINTEKQAMKNLAASIIIYEKVKTTEARAKKIRPIVEKLITKAKNDNLANQRSVFAYLPQKEAAKKIFEVLTKRYKERKGGYTRIVKLPPRNHDAAKQAEISLVEETKNAQ